MAKIELVLTVDPQGMIRAIRSRGHARQSGLGESLVCGIVSHSLRAFGRTIGRNAGLAVSGRLEQSGQFEMETSDITAAVQEWYRGACDMLIRGLQDVQQDYPDQVDMKIKISEQEI